MCDVVVIGAGLGGLTCGYVLQRNGYNVTVLEQGTQIGGCLQCFSRGGVRFETGMHFIGSASEGQTMDRMMRFFGLKDDVRLSELDRQAYNTVSLCGQEFRFPNSREAFIDRMSSYFPKERDALGKYVEIVDRVAEASTVDSLLSGNRDIAANTEFQSRSINDVLDSIFEDGLLKKVLVGDLPLYSAVRDRTPFSMHAFIMDFYNRSAYRVVGGSDSIARSLTESIRRMGGRVTAGRKVSRIVCDDTRATGVETSDGEFYPAGYVISTVHPNRLLEMLDTRLIRPAFRSRITAIPQTSSVFALYVRFRKGCMPYMNTNYFGYSGDTPWGCERYTDAEWPKAFLYMHMCHSDSPEWAESGVVLSYMNMSELSRWTGTAVGHRGAEYEAFKKSRAERLIGEVERHLPGFASSLESYYTSTPLTYRDYTGTEDGSIYGVARDITLGAGGRVPYRTKIPNLLLAGQNVNSHGIMGVMVSTMVTCSELVPVAQIYRQINESYR